MTARFDPATGEIVSDDAEPRQRPNLRVVEDPEKVRLKAEIEVLESQLKDMERDLRNKRAAIRRALNERERERQSYIRREEVELVFEVWKLATGHARSKLGPERFDAVRKALDLGYTHEQLEQAIEYVAVHPFVKGYERSATGTERQRHDDLPLICRKVERFASLGWEMKRQGGSA